MAIETRINYDNHLNFSFNPEHIEFQDGKAKLKDLRPIGAILHHSFNDSSENWGSKNFDMVTTGASIENGALSITSGQVSYATSKLGGLAQVGSKGSILLRVNFGFTGNPSGTVRVFRVFNSNDVTGLIELVIDTSGIWRIILKDSFGNTLASSVAVGSFKILENREYEVLWAFDTVLGFHRLFVDGEASATTLAYTFTRNGSNNDTLQIGSNLAPAPHAAKIYSATVFSGVHSTGGYDAFFTISETVYASGYTGITNVSSFLTDSISSFSAIGGSGASFVVNVGAAKKYYDGVAWVASTSPDKSNSAEVIAENIGKLDISTGANITFTAYLHSDGFSPSDVTQIRAEYDFDFIAKTPNRCTVYGAVIGANNTPIHGAIVSLSGDDFLNGETIVVNKASARTDASGRFELSTFETETSKTKVNITIEYKSGKEERKFTFIDKIIPNVDSVPISAL